MGWFRKINFKLYGTGIQVRAVDCRCSQCVIPFFYFSCPKVKHPVAELKGVVYSECKHYLEQYGSHRSMLNYLFRHRRIGQALEYYLAKVHPNLILDA